jgi:RNA polymerase sigma factor (sigma-70 family)
VQAAQGGDRNAFDQLDRSSRGGIERVLRSRGVQRAEDVADLTQEVLIIAWRRLPQLRDPERFRPWLWVIARRVAAGHGQRHADGGPEELSDDKESDAAGPDVVAELGQLSELVTTAIHGLSERDQVALSLMSVGFQPLDIADAMDVSPNTAKQIAKRARDRLREQLRVELSSRRRDGCRELTTLLDAQRLVDAARHARSCPSCAAAEDDLQLYGASSEELAASGDGSET